MKITFEDLYKKDIKGWQFFLERMHIRIRTKMKECNSFIYESDNNYLVIKDGGAKTYGDIIDREYEYMSECEFEQTEEVLLKNKNVIVRLNSIN